MAQRFRVLPRQYEDEDTIKQKQQRERNKALLITLFLLPGMTVFVIFVVIPIMQSAYFSMFRWDGFGPLDNFVGIDNYQRLLNHGIFQKALTNSLMIMFLSLFIQLPLSLALALMVGRGKLPGKKFIRTVLFVPYVFSEVITAIIWRYVFHPTEGLANVALQSVIHSMPAIGWLADRNIVLYSIFAVITWKYFGFHMILYMAGLQGIPSDLEDAARVDGANESQVLRNITLPMLGSTIRLTVFLSVLGSFQQFVIIWVLTEGGPANASELIATYLYKFGIQRLKLGYGSAVAVILFSITLMFSLGYQRIIMRQDFTIETET